MSNEFTGKTAIISGAAGGIGLALAEALARQGMNIVMGDIDNAALTKSGNDLREKGFDVLTCALDVTDYAQWEDIVANAKAKLLSFKLENEVEALKEQTRLDELEIARQNSEIEISRKEQQIANLQLSKERYVKLMLSLVVIVLVSIALILYRSYSMSRRKNAELHYLATHDALTECFNRRYLFDSLRSLFSESHATSSACLVMIDIDHFKKINDDFGHNAGDDALRSVAHVLRQNISDDDVLARFGGEEFCMVLYNISLKDALNVSEQARSQVESYGFGEIKLTCSIGVTSIELGASSPTELIAQADKALFFSKANGRNQVNVYNATSAASIDIA